MAGVRYCPLCQAEVPADAADGLCPECLFRQAILVHPEGGERETTGWTPAMLRPSAGFPGEPKVRSL